MSQPRPVAAGDMPALKAVIASGDLFPADMLDDMAADYLAGRGAGFWMTQDRAHKPASVAYCAPEPMTDGTWNLYLIAVHDDWQGRGLGSDLLRSVERRLQRDGQRILLVETSGNDTFKRTRAFYSDRGYDREACIRDFYQAAEDKVIFRKAL